MGKYEYIAGSRALLQVALGWKEILLTNIQKEEKKLKDESLLHPAS